MIQTNKSFIGSHQRLFAGSAHVPSLVATLPNPEDLKYFYDGAIFMSNLASESHQWYLMWKEKENAPFIIADALNKCDPTHFPAVYRILLIIALFPIKPF